MLNNGKWTPEYSRLQDRARQAGLCEFGYTSHGFDHPTTCGPGKIADLPRFNSTPEFPTAMPQSHWEVSHESLAGRELEGDALHPAQPCAPPPRAQFVRTPEMEDVVRNDERRRIARDLHDSAAQHLTAMNLGLAHLRNLNGDPKMGQVMDGLSRSLSDLHRDLRSLSYVLHPPQIERFGIDQSFRALCQGLSRRSGIAISLRLRGAPGVDDEANKAVYRVLQEALFNVLCHSQAKKVAVRLRRKGGYLSLLVADDGIGIGRASLAGLDDAQFEGVGLASMRAIVERYQGRLLVRDLAPRSGTIVAARFRNMPSHSN